MTSVTEIQAWQLCRYKWWLGYERRLTSVETNPLLLSGSAVHTAVGLVLHGEGHEQAATTALIAEGATVDQHDRFKHGVVRALGRIPKFVWESEWVVEELFEHNLTLPGELSAHGTHGIMTVTDGHVTIRMKPDLYRVTDDTIDLVEIKTTARDPGDYLLNNPQHEWYGLGLAARFDKIVQFQYVCTPTGERDKTPIPHVPWLFTKRRMEESEEELSLAVREMRAGRAAATNRGWWCGTCEFNKVCKARITGGNVEDVIATEYKEKAHAGS